MKLTTQRTTETIKAFVNETQDVIILLNKIVDYWYNEGYEVETITLHSPTFWNTRKTGQTYTEEEREKAFAAFDNAVEIYK